MFKDTWASTAGCESVPALEHVCRPKTVFCFARVIQAAGVTFSKDKKAGKRSKSGRSRRLSTGFGPACPGRILTPACKYSAKTGCGKGDLIFQSVFKDGHLTR